MNAVIMAGGFGTRMRPLTYNIPKPMVPVVNKPIMAHIVELLRKHGFRDILSILYYQPEVIEDYFRDGSEFGVQMGYISAQEDFGTAGSVKNAQVHNEDFFKETFIIISGDLLTDFDLTAAVEFHKRKKAKLTIALTRVEDPRPYGVVILDDDGKIVRFLEKPAWGEVFSDTINTGIYIIEPSVMDYIPAGEEFDFSKDLFPRLMENNEPLYGYVADGYWWDIGDLLAYHQAQQDVLTGKVDIEVPGERQKTIGKDIWIGEGSTVDRKVELQGSVVIGQNCVVKAGAKITNSVIGDESTVEEDASIADSILWDNVFVGRRAVLQENTIGSRTTIKAGAFVGERTVISDDCMIGSDSRIRASLKLWPHKAVEDGATLTSSLIWGDKWAKSLFGTYGVSGIAGTELTPEFASRLGAAYGATFRKGSYICASRDNLRASRMISRALIAGIVSTGVNIDNLEIVPEPVARFEINALNEAGGFHVRQSSSDPEILDIKFFGSNGMDVTSGQEKTIERLFFREDFRRVLVPETGVIEFPFRTVEYYREAFMNFIDSDLLKSKRSKIVIDFAYSSAATILPSILGEIDCDVVSLNAFMDETRLTRTPDETEVAIQQLSDITKTLKADVGFMFDAGAEQLRLVDETGKVFSGNEALAVVTLLMLKAGIKGKIAVPVTASRVIEQITKEHKVEVTRTKTNPRSMMETAGIPDFEFLGTRKGNYIFPKFYPVFDGMVALVKIVEMMTRLDTPLSQLLQKIPPAHMVREHVPCPWELKGTIMRNLIENTQNQDVELIDGVKINFGDDWVIIIPDHDRPIFHVNAEADTVEKANELTSEYVEKIREWQK